MSGNTGNSSILMYNVFGYTTNEMVKEIGQKKYFDKKFVSSG